MHLDAVARQCLSQKMGGIAFFVCQEKRMECTMTVRQPKRHSACATSCPPDHRTTADGEQARWKVGHVEQHLIDQIIGFVEAR